MGNVREVAPQRGFQAQANNPRDNAPLTQAGGGGGALKQAGRVLPGQGGRHHGRHVRPGPRGQAVLGLRLNARNDVRRHVGRPQGHAAGKGGGGMLFGVAHTRLGQHGVSGGIGAGFW